MTENATTFESKLQALFDEYDVRLYTAARISPKALSVAFSYAKHGGGYDFLEVVDVEGESKLKYLG